MTVSQNHLTTELVRIEGISCIVSCLETNRSFVPNMNRKLFSGIFNLFKSRIGVQPELAYSGKLLINPENLIHKNEGGLWHYFVTELGLVPLTDLSGQRSLITVAVWLRKGRKVKYPYTFLQYYTTSDFDDVNVEAVITEIIQVYDSYRGACTRHVKADHE